METSRKFFKIITVPDANRLRIPAEFMRRYGHNLPADRVFVQVPDGPLWNVKLIMSNGETWLENGWHKFRDYHSITIGNFLLFDYDGTSRFNVLIFDTSSTEIQYQLTNADHERVLDSTTEIRDHVYWTMWLRIRHMPVTRMKVMDDRSESLSVGNSSEGAGLKMQKIDKEKSMAYKKAVAFKSDNPGSNAFFICLMQPSYVTSHFNLNVPVSFAKGSLNCKHNDLVIRAPSRKTWSVKCSVGPSHAKFGPGWEDVVKANKLKVGDACVFEVVKNAKCTWSITIFRS